MRLHRAKCFISGSQVQNISNFQLIECRYWHPELSLVVPPSEWQGNPTLGLQCLCTKQNSNLLLRKKRKKRNHCRFPSSLFFSRREPRVIPEWSCWPSRIIYHLHRLHKREKMCSENQMCIMNGPMKNWHYKGQIWFNDGNSIYSVLFQIWNSNLNSCSGSPLSSNLMCVFTLIMVRF